MLFNACEVGTTQLVGSAATRALYAAGATKGEDVLQHKVQEELVVHASYASVRERGRGVKGKGEGGKGGKGAAAQSTWTPGDIGTCDWYTHSLHSTMCI